MDEDERLLLIVGLAANAAFLVYCLVVLIGVFRGRLP